MYVDGGPQETYHARNTEDMDKQGKLSKFKEKERERKQIENQFNS